MLCCPGCRTISLSAKELKPNYLRPGTLICQLLNYSSKWHDIECTKLYCLGFTLTSNVGNQVPTFEIWAVLKLHHIINFHQYRLWLKRASCGHINLGRFTHINRHVVGHTDGQSIGYSDIKASTNVIVGLPGYVTATLSGTRQREGTRRSLPYRGLSKRAPLPKACPVMRPVMCPVTCPVICPVVCPIMWPQSVPCSDR